MINKKMVGQEYEDTETGLHFVEDIRGDLHLVHKHEGSVINIPPPEVTVNPPDINLNPVINVEAGGINYENATLVILQSSIRSQTWPSIINFTRIPNSYATGYLNYTVPFGKTLNLELIVASQVRNGEGSKLEISYLGLYKDGNFNIAIPFKDDLNYKFPYPLVFPSTSFMEIKFKPFHTKVDLGILVVGYLL